MDALTSDRGQALVLAAVLLAVAAVALVGLRAVSDRILAIARDDRAGEAAVAAAGAVVADLQLARAHELGHDLDRAETAQFVADPAVTNAARDAAVRLARAHGRSDPAGIEVLSFGYEIEVHLTLAGRPHTALLEARP
ncbi:MAG: hypothetical protein KGN00_02260 [Chloroflexota bacterium]|nr:hypothetical protein [Chloroflexota bacterium]MDE3192488.1 hypothetical protein [Chloroflexota bacterium]